MYVCVCVYIYIFFYYLFIFIYLYVHVFSHTPKLYAHLAGTALGMVGAGLGSGCEGQQLTVGHGYVRCTKV